MKNEGNKNHIDNSRDELNKKIKNISKDKFINKIKEQKIKLSMKNNMNDDKKQEISPFLVFCIDFGNAGFGLIL